MRSDIRNSEFYLEEPIGKQQKYWILSFGKRFLYKKAGIKQDGSFVYNDVSECMAMDIANLIGIKTAEYYLCKKGNENGVITIDFLDNEVGKLKKEEFYDGVYLISQIDPGFRNTSLINPKTHQYYTLDLVIRSIYQYGLLNDVLNMVVFDSLIANSDRNPSNYGIIVNHENDTVRFAPLYDSCTSFGISMASHRLAKCFDKDGNIVDEDYLNEVIQNQMSGKITLERYFQYSEKKKWDEKESKRILTMIEEEREGLLKLVNENKISREDYHKALSNIGKQYQKFDIANLKYHLMIKYLTCFYPKEISQIMENIKKNITEDNIDRIFDFYQDELPIDRLNMAKQVVLKRAKWMCEYYENNKVIEESREK